MENFYEVAQKDGRWGFWAEAYRESEMIQKLTDCKERKVEREVAGVIFDEFEGRTEIRSVELISSRKEIVSSLKKERTFFEIPKGVEDFNSDCKIVWLGHIGCFNDPVQAQMLQTHSPHSIIFVFHKDEITQAITLSIDKESLVPTLSCCD
ncbi:MAG TPA: hypothetical protein VFQ59_00675 [Candidatus Paceibacterota bacterium]|nr:hypothetical protein [Candidatus Paceibacterota bacterium]